MAERTPIDGSPLPGADGGRPEWFRGLVAIAILLPILYLGRSFFIPLAVALLVFIVVLALGERTRRITVAGRHIPRWLAGILSFLIIFALMAATPRIVSDEVARIGDAAPAYVDRVGQRIESLAPLLGRATAARFKADLTGFDVGAVLPELLAPVGALFGSGILVLFYVIFMIVEREAFTRKLPQIVGSPGAFLSVPLMVVVMIVCAQIPPLRPIAALMSADGVVQTGEAADP